MKPVPGYPKYLATKDGRVYTTRLREGWLKPSADKNGYVRYSVTLDNGKSRGIYAHQIVASTYLPNPDKKKYVNHLDHDKSNNTVENLAWCTHLENIRHDWAMGKRTIKYGEESYNPKTTAKDVRKMRELYAKGEKQTALAEMFGISQPAVSQIMRGITWRAEL